MSLTYSEDRLPAEVLNATLGSDAPHHQVEALRLEGRLQMILPELEPTFGMAQNHYHFGTVWEHTLKALEVVSDETDDLTLRLATLLHDMGKPLARTVDGNGTVHFLHHDAMGSDLARVVLHRLGYNDDITEEVAFLVLHHMATKSWGNRCEAMKKKSLRRLQYACGTRSRFDRLLTVIHADNMAHAEQWCMPEQVGCIAAITDEMVAEGSAMFGFQPWMTDLEIKAMKGLEDDGQVKECQDYMLKLAFARPLMDRETAIRHLKGYRLTL